MRADGVEITQQNYVPFVIGLIQILQHGFQHKLRGTVGICGGKAAVFIERKPFGRTVNGCGRRENNLLHVIFLHNFQQRNRTADIVFVIFQRNLTAFAHGFQPGEMNYRVDFMRFENFIRALCVADVRFVKSYFFARELLNAAKTFLA